MTKRQSDPPITPLEASRPMVEWWTQQLTQGITPMARMQLAWMESLSEIMQQEARFFTALAESSQRLAKCYEHSKGDPMKMNECYREIAQEIAEQHMQRMEHVTTLSHDFRQQLWEEI
ncbi:hypothetical protein [Billgrantia endophytica]|uniref:Phasin domain-containing protein n=1 Tax=Billgrantia endophytica TaxID=2033802 RepID=A0A2N7TX63_9GAMM|nr:hypothetical protein [Halomonas endophytica]PMR72766.1 hypothetical protein C1H69_20185 [Halomonas endophytica]